jgi:hypothetical protein
LWKGRLTGGGKYRRRRWEQTMLIAEDLLDPVLVDRFGSADAVTLHEIVKICEEALVKVLGPGVEEFLLLNESMAQLVVPWVWDLARGLHYQSVFGPGAPLTIRLVDQLSSVPLSASDRDWISERIDLAYILTADRIAQFIQGRGGISRDPIMREQVFPWYGRLEIGYRIHLTTEALRLMPSP